MTLKTYTATISEMLTNGWPEDDEFIWMEPRRGVKQWMKRTLRGGVRGSRDVWTHRLDGPAAVYDHGNLRYTWWVDGTQAGSYSEFQQLSGCSDGQLIMLKLKYGEWWGRGS